MHNFDSYKNKAGLLNAGDHEPEHINENSFLFTLVYSLRHKAKIHFYPSVFKGAMAAHIKKLMDLKNGELYYNNVLPGDGLERDQYTSRDQMFAYAIWSKLYFSKEVNSPSEAMAMPRPHVEIWRTLAANWFTYDNVNGGVNFKRFHKPSDVIYLGYLAGNPICYLLMPIYYIAALWTALGAKPERSSGTQLLIAREAADFHLLEKPFWYIYKAILKKRYGKYGYDNWREGVFMSYYQKQHPVNQIA